MNKTDLEMSSLEISILQPWKVMIVDDEEEIHAVTQLVMRDFRFAQRPLEFISAYSGEEAMRLIEKHHDTALILLDVVMEKDDSGLRVVEYIRKELQNSMVRIVLRTGQPGEAPEETVITEYDINDYREKVELTAQKLHTTVISALRSFRDIKTIEAHNRDLRRVLHSSTNILNPRKSRHTFASDILSEILKFFQEDDAPEIPDGLLALKEEDRFLIKAGQGRYQELVHREISDALGSDLFDSRNSLVRPNSELPDHIYVGYSRTSTKVECLIYLEHSRPLSEWERNVLDLFYAVISSIMENHFLHQDVEESHRELLFTVADIVETRSRETGNHVKRVAKVARLLGLKHGMSEEEAEMLYIASTVHDIGKLAIPDSILSKPGRLTTSEYDLMKEHTTYGFNMLRKSRRQIMQYAAIVAHEHQEKYDGTGYPRGLKGEDIHLFARITAVADVFDALASKRSYKEAWSIDKITAYFREQSARHFDPVLVQLLFENLNEILAIKQKYLD